VLGNGGFARDGSPYCFCGHCLRAGLDRGIDPARAREGYLALYRLAHGEDDPDGGSGLVAFLRLLVNYPEILARERLWQDGYQAMQQQLYGTLKSLAPPGQRVRQRVPRAGGGLGRADGAAALGRRDRLSRRGDPKPVPADDEIRSLPNVFLSPHIAGVTAAAEPRFFDLMVNEVLRALAGDHPRHQLVPRDRPGA
jgi:hypothetical protein